LKFTVIKGFSEKMGCGKNLNFHFFVISGKKSYFVGNCVIFLLNLDL